MRAAIMRNGAIVVDEIDDLEPRDGHVVVRTVACGICGSDLHALKHSHDMTRVQGEVGGSMTFDPDRDLVMGHEFCAEIIATQSDAALPEGTLVCSVPMAFANGRPAAVGYNNDLPGGYAEQMLLSDRLLLPVPNGLDPQLAAMTEPMAVGRHAVEKSNATKDNVILVVGCGPVGLAVIASLKQKGLGPVIAADFSPRRRSFAEALGADIIIDPAETSPYETWTDAAWEGRLPDDRDRHDPMLGILGFAPAPGLVFECVGVPGLIGQVMAGSMRHSRVVVVGVCMEDDSIRPLMGISKELNLQFVLGYTPEEFADTLRGIAEGELSVAQLITGTVGLDGVADAFEMLADPEAHAKVMVDPTI